MFLMILIISLMDKSWSEQLYLSVKENTKPSNPIGNIQSMIKNQTKKWFPLQFKDFHIVQNGDNYRTKSLIKVDANNGDIWLQSSVDREDICQNFRSCNGNTTINYLFTVNSTYFNLILEILDINDNFPSFNSETKQIEIPEGTSKLTDFSLPVAKDEDSEKFGIERYELKSISNNDDFKNYFELFFKKASKAPYLRVIGDLDREATEVFEFYLYAIDGGNNQGKCRIIVKISDINDNTPQWIGLPYREKILECSTKKDIKRLMADDRDDKLNSGGQITFKISDNSEKNDIISKTFFISENTLYFTQDSLRILGQSNISVPVIAIDGGGRSNETTVDIEIIDCNDHFPVITIENPTPSVSENDNKIQVLTDISVTDEDYGVNSEFSCNLNDTSHVILTDPFIMDSQTRKGRTKIFKLQTVADMAFDRENTPRHIVEIVCSDNGHPQMTSSSIITMYITDQNDNKPKFDLEFLSFSVSEDAKIGSDVGRVMATDADISPNNRITYSIVCDENCRQTFTITDQGQIQLAQTIDREKVDRYKLKIVTLDSGKPSLNDSCDIQIMVLDVNDCRPEIAKVHHFTIVESRGTEKIHKNFWKLNATDQDYGVNGSLTYKLKVTFPNSDLVRVSPDGEISIFGTIDREKHDRIETEILVIDGGQPRHTSTTTIVFDVLDINDNKPKFLVPSGRFNNFINVSLDLTPGSIIYQLNATDPDKDENGTIEFSLTGPESLKKVFSVHQDGQITLIEKVKSSNTLNLLSVEAKDRGNPPLSNVMTFYIRYLTPKLDNTDLKRNQLLPRGKQNNYESNNLRNGSVGWSNIMMLIYFLAAAVFLIIVGIGGTFLYLWCRDQGFCQLRNSDKHVSSRDLHSSSYHKNTTKSDNTQSIITNMDVNNQLLRTRNDSYQVVESPQLVNYASLVKTIGGTPIDQAYQFRTMMQCGNYSDFHARSSTTPLPDKDCRELSPFNDGWDDRQLLATTVDVRNRNLSVESADNFYNDCHQFPNAATMPGTFADGGGQFATPSQSRRSANIIQSKNDLFGGYKPKVNYVASSFV